MADKLDELVSGVQRHIAEKRAELTALQTQARALQSAHADLHQEVEKAQDRLAAVRKALDDSNKELDKRRTEASTIANSIIADAHAKKAAAEEKVRDLYAASARDIARASQQLKAVEDQTAVAKTALQSANAKVDAAQSRWMAIKAQAGQLANS